MALVLVAAILLAAPCAGLGLIRMYYDDSSGVDGFASFQTNPAQRCYSFSCYDQVTYIKWTRMKSVAWIVFYEEAGCRGKSGRSIAGEFGSFSPNGMGASTARSMMLMESSVYPTRGFVRTCRHKNELRLRNVSLGDAVGSEDIGTNHSSRGDDIAIVGDEW